VPTVATTGEGRPAVGDPDAAVVAAAVDAVLVPGRSATTRPAAAGRLGGGPEGRGEAGPGRSPGPGRTCRGDPPRWSVRSAPGCPRPGCRPGCRSQRRPSGYRPRASLLPGRLPGSRAAAGRLLRERPAGAAAAAPPHPTRPRVGCGHLEPAGRAGRRLPGPADPAGRPRAACRREGTGGRGRRAGRAGAARRHPGGRVARPCTWSSRAGQVSSSSRWRTLDTASPSPMVRITESSRSSAAMRRA
jgi:hypothetical protein